MISPFGSIPVPKKGRTNFDLSHSLAGNFALGKVQPVFLTETIPGDAFSIDAYNITKLETLIAPAMQRMDASLLWFKIPKRLLFNKFKQWYSGGDDGQDSSSKPHIHINTVMHDFLEALDDKFGQDDHGQGIIQAFIEKYFGPGSLWSLLGLPVPLMYYSGVWQVIPYTNFDTTINEDDRDYLDIMPFMAYHMLYDTYFMDQTLNDSLFTDVENGKFKISNTHVLFVYYNNVKKTLVVNPTSANLADGGEIDTKDFLCLLELYNRAWRKDYFTSALPTPQRGPEVTLNMFDGQSLPVNWDGSTSLELRARNLGSEDLISSDQPLVNPHDIDEDDPLFNPSLTDNHSNLHEVSVTAAGGSVDMSGLSPITITAFRNLFKLQAFLEKNNVAGGRYIESILAHWAERVPDFTVQRPQFVRATSIPIQISDVVASANSATGVNKTLGDRAGLGGTHGNLGKIHIYTQEPSFVFGLFCVTPPPAYAQQGIPRMYQRVTRFDEPWTEFQHIGEQAIKQTEIFYDFSDNAENNQEFGYQQRFSEFKYMPDRVVGDFMTSLSYWHMARMFNTVPRLNGSFVTCTPDERIFAVQNQRPVISDFFFKIKAKRKLSRFSTPKLT